MYIHLCYITTEYPLPSKITLCWALEFLSCNAWLKDYSVIISKLERTYNLKKINFQLK